MDKESNINKEYYEIVKRYVQRLEEDGLSVKAAYIFGSTAKGTRNKWSDLDTCIISDGFSSDRLANRVFLMKDMEGISDLIEPHPFTQEDFDDKYNSLALEIKKWGTRVV